MYSANIFKLKVSLVSVQPDCVIRYTKYFGGCNKKRLGFFVHLVADPPDDPYYCRNSEDGNYPD